tara:strand:- start:226 stop:615 length:390 start_codon:yes stop_codon:yes gene_type:complete
MVRMKENTKITFSIDEKENIKEEINMEDLMNEIDKVWSEKAIMERENMDHYLSLETDYELNYIIPELQHIAKYYNISIRKKKKGELIQDIVIYEMDQNNMVNVSRRHYLWECLEQIKGDEYLRKFLNGI